MTSDQHPGHPEHHGVDVSLADVAGEDPRDGLVHEDGDAAGDGDVDGDPGRDPAGLESTDTPPEQPELSSMLGVGPVTEGDDPVI